MRGDKKGYAAQIRLEKEWEPGTDMEAEEIATKIFRISYGSKRGTPEYLAEKRLFYKEIQYQNSLFLDMGKSKRIIWVKGDTWHLYSQKELLKKHPVERILAPGTLMRNNIKLLKQYLGCADFSDDDVCVLESMLNTSTDVYELLAPEIRERAGLLEDRGIAEALIDGFPPLIKDSTSEDGDASDTV